MQKMNYQKPELISLQDWKSKVFGQSIPCYGIDDPLFPGCPASDEDPICEPGNDF